jgi:hypothetical protein
VGRVSEVIKTSVQLINLTPHPVQIFGEEGSIVLPCSAVPARLEGTTGPVGHVTVDGVSVAVVQHHYDRIVGLPGPSPGVLFVVSQLVLDFLPERQDLVTPSDLIRDESGAVIGCRALARR